ncbi:hypothetical protein CMEL01_13191, partial [Colletotrichum melonis]
LRSRASQLLALFSLCCPVHQCTDPIWRDSRLSQSGSNQKLAHVSVEMAASDGTIRPVLDIIKEVKEQGNGTEVKYNNLKVRRLLEEAAENFMLGLATVDKSVLEWLADDCTMIDPSLDKKSRPDYVVHGKCNIIKALGSDSPTAYKVRTSRYIPISTFVEQGKIFSYWEGLIRESTTKGANKAKEASKTTEALRAEEDMKGDFHVGKFGGAFVIYLDKNVMIKRVEFRYSEIVALDCAFNQLVEATRARKVDLHLESVSEETA